MLLTDAATLGGALLVALAVDALLGEPAWLYRWLPHPVVLIGRLISALEVRLLDPALKALPTLAATSLRRRGMVLSLVVILVSATIATILQWLSLALPLPWLWLGLLASSLLAFRSLHDHVAAVARGLEKNLADGRRAVAHIVGRDPEQLDRHAVARAAIESTAESFADGVVAPLLFALLLGLPGMAAYKALNTLDSMIGHRTPRHLFFGRFAARLDDVANWLPARLAAFLILVAGVFSPNADPIAGWRALWHDARHHRSPNAGWPEAAMAGCLDLRLAGPRSYAGTTVDDAWMGPGRTAATPTDIRQALRLLALATLFLFLLLATPMTGALLVS